MTKQNLTENWLTNASATQQKLRVGGCNRQIIGISGLAVTLLLTLANAGCTPTVKVATDEPITINLNVNIKHEIRIKVDKELDDLFGENSDLF